MCVIPPRRFRHFVNQLGGIAYICKSKLLERRVLRFVKSCFGDALKTQVSKMQYPLREMLVFHVSAIPPVRFGRLWRVKRYFEGPSHVINDDISLEVLHKS